MEEEVGPKDTEAAVVLKKTYAGEDLAEVKQEFEAYIRAKEERERWLVF